MKMKLHRIYLGETYTIGKLYYLYNGEWVYLCDTLEDRVRDRDKDGKLDEQKIYGETAIPYGTYKMVISYSPKFGKNLPLLLDVPEFKGIRIHGGVTSKHTEGCILVGYNTEKGKLTDSKSAMNNLMKLLTDSKDKYHEVEII